MEQLNKILQTSERIANLRGKKRKRDAIYTPTIAGDIAQVPFEVLTDEQQREWHVAFLRNIATSESRNGRRDDLIDYLEYAAKRLGLEFNMDNAANEEMVSFEQILQNPIVIEILDSQVQESQAKQRDQLNLRMLLITPEEVSQLEQSLTALNILPLGLTLKGISTQVERYDGELGKQDYVRIRADVLPTEENFPVLANNHRDLLPGTAINRSFFIGIDVEVTDDAEPKVAIKLTDPQIPTMILWHSFSEEQLRELAREKVVLESVVKLTNERFSLQEIDIQSVLEIVAAIVERVKLAHEA